MIDNTYGRFLLSSIESSEQAEQLAIDWQHWAGEQDLSYGELADWQALFEQLAEDFNLTDVFRENGII